MKTIEFAQINETLYHEKLDNGLEVYMLPKPGFNKTFATFTTKYGSIDHHFKPLGKDDYVRVPDGIAHFLEHKMFEKESGDVFQLFSQQGASANAFTSFTRTAYLFSSTDNVEQNLETLINMVQEPYFTEQTVEKEKGIIAQEIKMYDDNPDWRVYFGVIENMYHHHPVKIDIAGTVESITKITHEMLYECYHTFYHPSNMLLFVTGPINPNEMIQLIKKNQSNKQYAAAPEVDRIFDPEPSSVANRKQVLKMNVQIPKCFIGMKALHVDQEGKEMLKQELLIGLLLDILFGRSSDIYEQLVNNELIDETFQFDYTQEHGFGFAIIGSDSKKPDEFADKIKSILMEAKQGQHLTEDALERAKKKQIGRFLRSLNSQEYIANQFTRYAFNRMDLFDVVPVLEQLTFEELVKITHDFIDENRFTVCQVLPKS